MKIYNAMFYYDWCLLLPLCYVGNGLALLGSAPRARKSSAYLYMAVLACSETFFLSRKKIDWTIYFGFTLTDLYCQLTNYLMALQSYFHVYILLLLSIERAIAVTMPLRAVRLFSVKKGVVALSCILVFSAVATFDSIYTIASIDDHYCIYSGPLMDIIHWIYVKDDTLFLYVPFFVLVICNMTIIISLGRSTKSRQQMGGTREQGGAQIAKDRHITIICLLVSFMHVVLISPSFIWLELDASDVNGWEYKWTCEHTISIFILHWFFVFVFNLNPCLNGYLYCLSSASFRAEVKKTIVVTGRTMKNCLIKMRWRDYS
jgi:hypothetical protein